MQNWGLQYWIVVNPWKNYPIGSVVKNKDGIPILFASEREAHNLRRELCWLMETDDFVVIEAAISGVDAKWLVSHLSERCGAECVDDGNIPYSVEYPRENSTNGKKHRKTIPNSIRRKVFEEDEYRCKHCGSWKNLTIDHIIPIAENGTNNINNLQTLCQSCNTRKGKKTDD